MTAKEPLNKSSHWRKPVSWRLKTRDSGSCRKDETVVDQGFPKLTRRLFCPIVLVACALAACNDEETSNTEETSLPAPQPPSVAGNERPTADAGGDRVIVTGSLVTLNGQGSDPDGDVLAYRWALTSEPAGASTAMTRADRADLSFTPAVEGAYIFELIADDGALESAPDAVTVTSVDESDDGPGASEPSGPVTQASTTVSIADNFGNGEVRDSDLAVGFWHVTSGTGASVVESNGTLAFRSAGARVSSGLSHELNFFLQPLRFSLHGLSFSGDPASRPGTGFEFALTSTEEPGRAAPDAIELSIAGNHRIVLAYKTDSPGSDARTVLLDRMLTGAPTHLELTLDHGSYRLVASAGNGRQIFRGRHDISRSDWGGHGSSALALRTTRRTVQGNIPPVPVLLDAIEVISLKFFDVFANGSPGSTGSRDAFWASTGSSPDLLLESGNALTLMSGGLAGIGSRSTRDFNFFAQQLEFSGELDVMPASDGGLAIARFGLAASQDSLRVTPSAMALSIDSSKRLRLGWKTEDRGSLPEEANVLVSETLGFTPTGFDLSMSKSRYSLTVRSGSARREFSGTHAMKWYDWSSTGNASLTLEAESPSDTHGGAIASWRHLSVLRDQEYYVAPTVLGPVGDGIDLELPDLDPASHPLLQAGLLDVTKSPFNADPTGHEDATHALQHAMNFAREQYLVTFLPAGEYLISDTLSCAQSLIRRTSSKLLNNSEGPCHLLGSRAEAHRPRLVLAADSAGFSDPARPRPVVNIWARSYQGDPEQHQPNISYNQMFVNIDIEIGRGNAGAIGIRHQGAQGTAVQESTIDATHGFAGLDGGSGSGGSHADVTVIGGQYGLHLRTSQPAATITGITLSGQSKSAILYGGRQTLSAVGIRIVVPAHASGPAIRVQGRSAQLGQVSLVDSVISFERASDDNVAIWTDSSIYLRDVYTKNAGIIVETSDGSRTTGQAGNWSQIREYAKGINPPPYATSIGIFQFEAPVYGNGIRASNQLIERGPDGSAPPTDLQSRHLWSRNFPGWESPGAANVTLAPYFAKGDGVADDSFAIQRAIDDNRIVFLPKGYFRISRPLVLHADTRLIGVSRTLSNLVADSAAAAFSDASNPQPLIVTDSDPGADTVLAFLQLRAQVDAAGAYALHWRAGRNSIFRAININRLSEHGYAWAPGKDPSPGQTDFPLVRVSGHGGGKWYNFHQGQADYMAPGYRHILIEGTTQALSFYQFNPEHAQGEANAEVRNASNVSFYGVKGESNYPVLWIRDSDHVNVYGYGGNAAALAAGDTYPPGFQQFMPSLFRVERTTNLRMVNLVDEPRVQGGHPVFGFGMNPGHWHMLLEVDGSNRQIATVVLDRPVLYQRAAQ